MSGVGLQTPSAPHDISGASRFRSVRSSTTNLAATRAARTAAPKSATSRTISKTRSALPAVTSVTSDRQFQRRQSAAALSIGTAIEARIGWTDGNGNFDGSGHFVAITAIEPTTSMLHVADPWYRTSSIAYDDFARAYKSVGVWTDTYLIDRLVNAESGPPPTPAESSDLYAYLSAASSTMKGQSVAPLLTLALDRAALPNPLQGVRQTGMQGIDATHRSLNEENLRDPRTLQVPSLLVTALIAKKGDAVVCKPIGRAPSFLDPKRLYTQDEFEAILQTQAQRKLRLIAKLNDR